MVFSNFVKQDTKSNKGINMMIGNKVVTHSFENMRGRTLRDKIMFVDNKTPIINSG